jgi:hypothetical protein
LKKPSLVRKSPSASLRKSSTPSAESWRLSGSGRPEIPDAVLSVNTCWIEWTNGISLRRWRSNSTNGSGAHLMLRTWKKRLRLAQKFRFLHDLRRRGVHQDAIHDLLSGQTETWQPRPR